MDALRSKLWPSTLLLALAFVGFSESNLGLRAALAQTSDPSTPNLETPNSGSPTPQVQPTPNADDLQGSTPAGVETKAEPKGLSVTEAVSLGDKHYTEGDYAGAVAAYSQALAIYDLHAYALYNRGNAYRQLEDYKSAIADFNKSLQIDPDNNFAYLYRGMALIKDQQADAAIRDFNHLIERNFKLPLAYHKRGESYMLKENYEAAAKDLDKAAKLYNGSGDYRQYSLIQKQAQAAKAAQKKDPQK